MRYFCFRPLPRFSDPLRGVRTAGKGEESPGTAAPNGAEPIRPLPPLAPGSAPAAFRPAAPKWAHKGGRPSRARSGSSEHGSRPRAARSPQPRPPSRPRSSRGTRGAAASPAPGPGPARTPRRGRRRGPAWHREAKRRRGNGAPPRRGPRHLGAPHGPRRAERSGPPGAPRPPPPHLEAKPRNQQTNGTAEADLLSLVPGPPTTGPESLRRWPRRSPLSNSRPPSWPSLPSRRGGGREGAGAARRDAPRDGAARHSHVTPSPPLARAPYHVIRDPPTFRDLAGHVVAAALSRAHPPPSPPLPGLGAFALRSAIT